MKRTFLALCLTALPFATSCTSYSDRHFVGSSDYELTRLETGDGVRETYHLNGGNTLQVTTDYERERPTLGLRVEELPKGPAERRGVKPYSGLIVVGTEADSPARRAGLRNQDVLLGVGEQETVYLDQFRDLEQQLIPGPVTCRVLRGDQEITVDVDVELIREPVRDVERVPLLKPPQAPRPYAGVTLRGIPAPWCARIFGEPRDAVVVSEVEVGSPAWLGGFRPGDVIERVDGEPVPPVNELARRIAEKGRGGAVMNWEVRREQGQTYSGDVALHDYSGTAHAFFPILFSVRNGTYEDRWSIGWGLVMGNRNTYVDEQRTREVLTRNRFSALLGLIRVDSRPDETRVRLLWFISFDT